jgi:hypothetical protein
VADDVGSGSVSVVWPFVEGSIVGVESGLPLSVIALTSEDFITIDDSDGSTQIPAPSFSVPFAEEFVGFLPAGSPSKDWEDFYSSLPTDRVGMSNLELLKEAFAPACKHK